MATGKAARARTPRSSPTRSASRPRARPACSPSSTAAATSSGCTPATLRARACRRRCSPSRASKARRSVIEARDGFMQAFAFGRIDKARPIKLPPAAEYGITDCYIKPYACCRHIQPAVEAMFGLVQRREDRVRGHQEGRGRDLQDRGRARACAVGRFRQRAVELPVSDGARGALPRRQVRAFRREDPEGSGVRRVRAASSRSRRRPRSTSSIRGCAPRASR